MWSFLFPFIDCSHLFLYQCFCNILSWLFRCLIFCFQCLCYKVLHAPNIIWFRDWVASSLFLLQDIFCFLVPGYSGLGVISSILILLHHQSLFSYHMKLSSAFSTTMEPFDELIKLLHFICSSDTFFSLFSRHVFGFMLRVNLV